MSESCHIYNKLRFVHCVRKFFRMWSSRKCSNHSRTTLALAHFILLFRYFLLLIEYTYKLSWWEMAKQPSTFYSVKLYSIRLFRSLFLASVKCGTFSLCVCVNLTYNMFTLLSHPHFISTLFEFLRRVALFSSVWVCAVRLFFSSSCTLSCKPKHQCEWHGAFVCSYNFITDKLIF